MTAMAERQSHAGSEPTVAARTAVAWGSIALVSLVLLSCDGDPSTARTPTMNDGAARSPCFVDVTADLHLDFVHENGASGKRWFVETNGSGATWLDFDGDRRLDLFLMQGAALPGFTATRPLHDVLLRATAQGFVDATPAEMRGESAHGMAAAHADYDNDGDPDLYVTNYGPNVLWRNDGGGRFTDVTTAAGVADGDRYHSSCAWADFDRDGDLDLYVAGYVDFRVGDGKTCGEPKRGPEFASYCHPDMYQGIDDTLFRNDGNGTFTDVSREAGLAGARGKGLGVAIGDFDDDGDADVFVANDSDPNFLWRNDSKDGALRFANVAALWGVEFNGEGRTQSCMGTAFGDVDGDLDLDLFTVNLSNETNTLWLKEGDHFRDRSYASGMAGPSMPNVGFGTLLADLDNDGDQDVVVANGHVLDNAELLLPGITYRQQAQLCWNDGTARFTVATPSDAGSYFGERHVGRGLAAADFDDDGDLDLLFTHNREQAQLLRNERGSSRSWIGFELVGKRSPSDGSGAELLVRAGDRTLRRATRIGESYLCGHDRRVLVGLGDARDPVDIEILWPSGTRQTLQQLPTRQYHRVEEPR
ncbi:MAG: CRTAC1 family protein [Myxococcales bacterium]|nr:CRTAC1 family protein [Myxococcales bacterium]